MIAIHKTGTGFLLAAAMFLPCSLWADLPPETRWSDPSNVHLEIEFPGDGYNASWELSRCDCGDLLVHSQLNVPGEAVEGDLLLVGNSAVLSRGFGRYRAEAASSLDAAGLMMQLALRLLERSEPAGPARITDVFEVNLEDNINHIHLDTGTAVGGFQAPWAIEGRISAVDETRRRFDLRFAFSINNQGEVQKSSMRLMGLAEYAESEFPVAGDSDISDWDISWRNPSAEIPGNPATLDELREMISNR